MNIRKIVSAFAVGVTILAFTYLAVYVLGGLDAYLEEIKRSIMVRNCMCIIHIPNRSF